MNSQEIRESFTRFFEERGHARLPSSPLVPYGDPTLLFTSAGMVQFKPYFQGQAEPPARRLTTIQKCFRTSDIDSVGDASHLTFFEMLGNFSVGDYFKEQAIPWAWEYVTQVLKLPQERLWAAVYLDDDEAYKIWEQVGVPRERIMHYGEESNYWYSGALGPCGPCSEIHYDFGPVAGCPQCAANACHPEAGCGRFLEIWNLVFMSYLRHEDGSKTPLPQRNIDTGAGLERLAVATLHNEARRQGLDSLSVYDTDLFRPIISRIEELSEKRYGEDPKADRAMRIVAEHARAAAFLIAEGIIPSNEGRGYVLRRILRRAIFYGRQLQAERYSAGSLAEVGGSLMGRGFDKGDLQRVPYPELQASGGLILEVMQAEEERFADTMARGLERLSEGLQRVRDTHLDKLSGQEAFVLHDTYGFPMELTREIARGDGLEVNEEEFQRLMEEQRERGRAAARFGERRTAEAYVSLAAKETPFLGYDGLTVSTVVIALVRGGQTVERAEKGETVEVTLSETPFYPEGGGQVGDAGEMAGANGRIEVTDTQRVAERFIVHRGRVVEGRIEAGEAVMASVDAQRRADIMRNHTATHLLHETLRRVLGSHVRQAGSLVAPERLRFDFSHIQAVKPEELAQIQRIVNEKVRADLPVHTRQAAFRQALGEGILAFFDEKYGEQVRVVEVADELERGEGRFSGELCGGTHCHATGQIGLFLIVSESGIGAGMRRIEAITGRAVEEYVARRLSAGERLARRLGVDLEQAAPRLEALYRDLEEEKRRVESLERKRSQSRLEDYLSLIQEVDGVRVLATTTDATDMKLLRELGDMLKERLQEASVIVLSAMIDNNPRFVAMVSPDVTGKGLHAGEIVSCVAALTGGRGGGRKDMAQGGGNDAHRVPEALGQVASLVQKTLAGEDRNIR